MEVVAQALISYHRLCDMWLPRGQPQIWGFRWTTSDVLACGTARLQSRETSISNCFTCVANASWHISLQRLSRYVFT